MLEEVLHLRKRRLFVDKFCSLQVYESLVQRLFGLAHHLFEQAERELFADDCQDLQQLFLGYRKTVDTRSQDRLHGRWEVEISRQRRTAQRPSCTVGRAHPTKVRQHSLFSQCLHDLLYEKRVTFGLLQDELLERL